MTSCLISFNCCYTETFISTSLNLLCCFANLGLTYDLRNSLKLNLDKIKIDLFLTL